MPGLAAKGCLSCQSRRTDTPTPRCWTRLIIRSGTKELSLRNTNQLFFICARVKINFLSPSIRRQRASQLQQLSNLLAVRKRRCIAWQKSMLELFKQRIAHFVPQSVSRCRLSPGLVSCTTTNQARPVLSTLCSPWSSTSGGGTVCL